LIEKRRSFVKMFAGELELSSECSRSRTRTLETAKEASLEKKAVYYEKRESGQQSFETENS
jgi:hypothetical protein